MPVYPVDDSEDNSVDLPALASPGMVRAAVGYSGTELHNIAVQLYKDDYWTPSPRPVPHVHSSRNPIRFPAARPTEQRRGEDESKARINNKISSVKYRLLSIFKTQSKFR